MIRSDINIVILISQFFTNLCTEQDSKFPSNYQNASKAFQDKIHLGLQP